MREKVPWSRALAREAEGLPPAPVTVLGSGV